MMFSRNSRELTGDWYLKRTPFGFKVIVETVNTTECSEDFSISPEFKCWEKAKDQDLVELKIKVV